MNKLCKLKEIFKEIYRFEQELKKSCGLSVNDVLALCSLSRNSFTSGELAKDMGLSPGRMSKIIAGLEDKGCIERRLDTKDRRIMHFSITSEGRSVLETLDIDSLKLPDCAT